MISTPLTGGYQPWALPWITEYWDGQIGADTSTWTPVKGTHAITWTAISLANGVYTFNGTTSFGTTAAFTVAQPYTLVLCFKQISWTDQDHVLSCETGGVVYQDSASPKLSMFAGSAGAANRNGPAIGSFGILVAGFSGASSYLQIDLNTPTTGNPGTNSMGYFRIGVDNGGTKFGNIAVMGAGYADSLLSAAQASQTVSAVARRYGVTV